MTDKQNPKVWPVTISFVKRVLVFIEAETIPKAKKVAERAALDMEVLEAVGSDYDVREVQLAPSPTNLAAVVAAHPNDEVYVWRAGERWPLCDEAAERLEELRDGD